VIRALLLVLAIAAAGACAPAPAQSASAVPDPTTRPTAISEAQAISIARAQPSPRTAPDDSVLDVRQGSFADLGSDYEAPGATPAAEPDRCVWRVNLGYDPGPLMGHGSIFIIDCLSGEVIQAYTWIS
jgi:hypothetical protein